MHAHNTAQTYRGRGETSCDEKKLVDNWARGADNYHVN